MAAVTTWCLGEEKEEAPNVHPNEKPRSKVVFNQKEYGWHGSPSSSYMGMIARLVYAQQGPSLLNEEPCSMSVS